MPEHKEDKGDKEEKEEEDKDVDGGYAWVILIGCYIMYLIVIGTIKSYGILYTELDEYYNVGSGPVALIGSLFLGCLFGLGPFANYIAVKTSFRKATFAGGLLLGIGFGVSCFVDKLEYLVITLGCTAAIGYGLSFAPCSTIISFYFKKRRALANGITVSASGIGAIAFSFLYRVLVVQYSLKPSMLIIGGIFFNVCVAACCFKQPKLLLEKQKQEKQAAEAKKKRASQGERLLKEDGTLEKIEEDPEEEKKCCSWGPDFKFSLLKNPRFTLYAAAFMICSNGYNNNLVLIPAQTRFLGYGKDSVALTVSVMGACEIWARILVGWLADKGWISAKNIFSICFVISAVFAFITPFFDSVAYMCVYAAVIGIFPASFWSLIQVLMIDVVGMKDFPAGYGLTILGLGVGALVSQPLIAWIKDLTGNWNASFYLTGVLLLLPAILMTIEPLVIPSQRKKNKTADIEDPSTNGAPVKLQTFASDPGTSEKETDSLLDEEIKVSIMPDGANKNGDAFEQSNNKNIDEPSKQTTNSGVSPDV